MSFEKQVLLHGQRNGYGFWCLGGVLFLHHVGHGRDRRGWFGNGRSCCFGFTAAATSGMYRRRAHGLLPLILNELHLVLKGGLKPGRKGHRMRGHVVHGVVPLLLRRYRVKGSVAEGGS